jgi:hypothetical protein
MLPAAMINNANPGQDIGFVELSGFGGALLATPGSRQRLPSIS